MIMTLNQQVIYAIDHPYEAVLLPAFGQKGRVNTLIRQLTLLKSQKTLPYLLRLKKEITGKSDLETLKIVGRYIVELSQDESTYRELAKYYGLQYPEIPEAVSEDEATNQDNPLPHRPQNTATPSPTAKAKQEAHAKIVAQVQENALRPLKRAYNHLTEHYRDNHGLSDSEVSRISYRTKEAGEDVKFAFSDYRFFELSDHTSKSKVKKQQRAFNQVSDKVSLVLTFLVAIGQAGIAACCFIAGGIAMPWFWPIFGVAFIANFLLMKPDIKQLLRKISGAFFFKKDFLEGLSGTKRIFAYASLVFAIASGFAFGLMALGTTYSAFMAILPALGLGFMAIPGIGWAIAGVVAVATIPVLTALMFKAMADFIRDWDSHVAAFKNYFSFKDFDKLSGKEKATFILSRVLQPLLAVTAATIVFFAVVATFGSYSSDITATLHKVFGVSAKVSYWLSLSIVFVCNLIPELVFNFRNVMTFFKELPNQFKTVFNRAGLIFKSDVHPAAKLMTAGLVALTVVTLGLVCLNGYGNGMTGSQPGGDGVGFLRKLFGMSGWLASAIALVTSTSTSLAANETYAMEELNRHTPIGHSGPRETPLPSQTLNGSLASQGTASKTDTSVCASDASQSLKPTTTAQGPDLPGHSPHAVFSRKESKPLAAPVTVAPDFISQAVEI